MQTPEFFQAVSPIVVVDPLAEFLGAAADGLLRFGVPMAGDIRFTRLDTGAAIELAHRPQAVPRPEALAKLMPPPSPEADATRRRAFAIAWQDWVRTLLLDHADDPALIEVAG